MHGVLMGGAGRDTGMPARAEVLIHRRRCYQHVPVMTAQGEFRSMTGSSHLRLLRLAALCVCLLGTRSEEHTSELQSLMRISYAVFSLKNKINDTKKESVQIVRARNDHI